MSLLEIDNPCHLTGVHRLPRGDRVQQPVAIGAASARDQVLVPQVEHDGAERGPHGFCRTEWYFSRSYGQVVF